MCLPSETEGKYSHFLLFEFTEEVIGSATLSLCLFIVGNNIGNVAVGLILSHPIKRLGGESLKVGIVLIVGHHHVSVVKSLPEIVIFQEQVNRLLAGQETCTVERSLTQQEFCTTVIVQILHQIVGVLSALFQVRMRVERVDIIFTADNRVQFRSVILVRELIVGRFHKRALKNLLVKRQVTVLQKVEQSGYRLVTIIRFLVKIGNSVRVGLHFLLAVAHCFFQRIFGRRFRLFQILLIGRRAVFFVEVRNFVSEHQRQFGLAGSLCHHAQIHKQRTIGTHKRISDRRLIEVDMYFLVFRIRVRPIKDVSNRVDVGIDRRTIKHPTRLEQALHRTFVVGQFFFAQQSDHVLGHFTFARHWLIVSRTDKHR